MGQARNWTKEEYEYLQDKWGSVSLKHIAKTLNRSESAIKNKIYKLGLGAFLINGEYITFNQLLLALGNTGSSGYKMISWVKNRNFPLKTKKVNNNSFNVVYLEEFWTWAEKNKDLLDFSKFEEKSLGVEPEWAKIKRKHDFERNKKYIKTPWTKTEDEKLKYLLKKHKHTYDDLSRLLRRTNGAIQRRVCDLGIKERPAKIDNLIKWTNEEFKLLGDLIKLGYGYDLMAEKIGKSSKAIRGRVYSMYMTENLDKAREYIGTGEFGENRPDRKISQYNIMNAEERQQVKELVTRLAAIMRFEYKQFFNEEDYWQKDMCMHWDNGKGCIANEVNCDSCISFQRIRPQYCVTCGKEFISRVKELRCVGCREMRKKNYLRKKMALAR